MSAKSSIFVVAWLAAGCGGGRPPEAAVVAADLRPAREPSAVDSAHVEEDRFPAGPGVTLMKDDLDDARGLLDYRATYEARLEKARARLGVDGDETTEGVVFRGVGPKNPTGPFDCYELAIERSNGYAAVVRVDRRLCGLPYRAQDDAKTPYSGPGPRFTLARMRRVMNDAERLPPKEAEGMALARLGPPDPATGKDNDARNDVRTWTAIGPRDDEAPITCHVLVAKDGEHPRIERRALADCAIAWPPPKEDLARDETIPSPLRSTSATDCAAKCTTNDACVVRRVAPKDALFTARGEDLFVFALDGRPAKMEITTSCTPIPQTCLTATAPTSSCIFPPPSRPCLTANDIAFSSTWNRPPNGTIWTMTCNVRKK